MLQRIYHGRIVSAVASGLHHHVTRKAQLVAQRKQLVFAGVAWCVLALRRKGKLLARTKHVAVRIYRAGGHLKAWFGWVCIPVQPVGGFGEVASCGFAHRGTSVDLIYEAKASFGQRLAHVVHV